MPDAARPRAGTGPAPVASAVTRLRRRLAGPSKRAWRTIRPALPHRWAREIERRGVRDLKRLGLVGPVALDLPGHPPPRSWDEVTSQALGREGAECPLCGTKAAGFLPGARGRPDERCPTCGSLGRHRLVWLYLGLRTDLFDRPVELLHLAPEPHLGTYLRRQPTVHYLSADLAARSAMVEMDITAIDRPDGSFDAIYASHVLEHVADDRRAMAELRRVLRPGGWALLMVPMWGPTTREDPDVTDPDERARRFGQEDHVRMYGHDGELERRLGAAGFTVTVEDLAVELGADVVHRHRLPTRELLYLCRPA